METFAFTVLVVGDSGVEIAALDLRSQLIAIAKDHMRLDSVEIDVTTPTAMSPVGLLIGS